MSNAVRECRTLSEASRASIVLAAPSFGWEIVDALRANPRTEARAILVCDHVLGARDVIDDARVWIAEAPISGAELADYLRCAVER